MEQKELEKLVDDVYSIIGERYSKEFKYIIGGCHCYPTTEWYGEVYLVLKKVLNDNEVNEKHIREQISIAVEQLSKNFTY